MVNLFGSDYSKEFTKENYIITRYGLFMIMVNDSLKVERETTIVYGWYTSVSGIGPNVVRREHKLSGERVPIQLAMCCYLDSFLNPSINSYLYYYVSATK